MPSIQPFNAAEASKVVSTVNGTYYEFERNGRMFLIHESNKNLVQTAPKAKKLAEQQSIFSFSDLGGHVWWFVGTGKPVPAQCAKPLTCKVCIQFHDAFPVVQ